MRFLFCNSPLKANLVEAFLKARISRIAVSTSDTHASGVANIFQTPIATLVPRNQLIPRIDALPARPRSSLEWSGPKTVR